MRNWTGSVWSCDSSGEPLQLTMDASVDSQCPHLICDCLVQIFTFLGEEDLIIASSVCQVSRARPVCGSRGEEVEVDIPLKCAHGCGFVCVFLYLLGLARSRRDSLVMEVSCIDRVVPQNNTELHRI